MVSFPDLIWHVYHLEYNMQYLKVSYQGDTLGKQHIVLIFDMFIEWPLLYVDLYTVLIEVSLSEPHTSETALCMHMCMLACL